MNKKIILLGGGGFIGTNLHKYFQATSNNSFSISTSFQEKLLNQIKANALEINHIKKYLDKNSIVIDLLNTPLELQLIQHQKLLQELQNFPIKKIVYISSAAVYGETTQSVTENTKTNPISDYGNSKAIIENTILNNNLPYLIFRLSSCYGPGQYSQQIIPNFFNSIIKNESPIINNQGTQVRDFIYIDDFVKIINQTISNLIGIYNLNSNNNININQLWDKISKLTNTNIVPIYKQNNIIEIKTSVLNNQKLNKIINYQFTSLDQGLEKTYNWFKKQH